MNILILHQHFNTPQSGGALRSYFLAKAAADAGHQVTVVAGGAMQYQTELFEGISIHRLPVRYSNYFGFWKRIFSFARYVLLCVLHAGKFKHNDICYAISTPLTIGLAAQWLKWRHKIPYVFEVGDLWPDVPIALDVIENRLLKDLLWRLETRIYQKASSVIALSPAIQSAIEKKTPTVNVHLIPNMADTEFFQPSAKPIELEKKYHVEGKLVVSYFGAVGFANGLENLLHAIHGCEQAQLPVHFLLAGDGVELTNLQQLAQQLQLNNISFLGFRNRAGISELMQITDAIFVSFRPAPILETGSPNKLFDGLAAGKMIILNFSGWLRIEIERSACGFYVDPNQPNALSLSLQRLLKSNELHTSQRNARDLAIAKYSRNTLCRQWLDVLEQKNRAI